MRLGGNKILKIRKVTKEELALAMNRMEMLREVNKLGEDYSFSESLALKSKLFFEIDDQTTLLAIDTDVIGCAKICYMEPDAHLFTSDWKAGASDECICQKRSPWQRYCK